MYRSSMFTEKTLEIFRRYVEVRHGNNMTSASRELGVHITTLEKWLKGTRIPRIDNIGPCMDIIGVRVLVPGDEEDQAQPSAPAQSLSPCSSEVARLRARIMELEREIGATRTERDKAIGQVELLKEQLATESAKKDVASAERVSSPATRGSTRAG